uniref:Uncharacterized protein n=1 Tax=Arundo donax TaxID=35708 RepID=A0A0A9B2X3_ARUDO
MKRRGRPPGTKDAGLPGLEDLWTKVLVWRSGGSQPMEP